MGTLPQFSLNGPHSLHKLRGRIDCIEAMRTIICFWVVFCHHSAEREKLPSFLDNLIYNNQGAAYGFIVLSGFITHWTARDEQFETISQIGHFFSRRFGRVGLAYWMALGMCFVIRFNDRNIKGLTYSFWQHIYWTGVNLGGLQSWYSWTEDEVYNGPLFHLCAPLWTLSALAFCWFCYPFVQKFVIMRGNLGVSLTCLATTIFIALAHRTYRPGSPTHHSSGWGDFQGYYWFPPYTLELFLLGVFGAEIAAIIPPGMFANLLCSIGVDFAFVMFILMNGTNWDITYGGLYFSFGCYCRTIWLLVGCILSTQTESFILGSRWCGFLSGMSKYTLPIYVFHSPVVNVLWIFAYGYPINPFPHINEHWKFFIYFCVVLCFAKTYYHLTEEKLVGGRHCDENPSLGEERKRLVVHTIHFPSASQESMA